MDNQDSSDASETMQYAKVDIPQCEVVIEETECSSLEDPNEIQGEMITYVVIPNEIDPEGIIINYCGTVKEEEDDDPAPVSNDLESQNQCVLCGETFKNCFLMQEHFSSVHIGTDLSCQICRLQCATDLQLMRHYNKHRYSCNLCEASFGKYEDLVNHKKTHSQTLPYACNICNKAYSSTREISVHIRETHNHKRPLGSEEGNKNKKIANQGIVQIMKEGKT